MRAIRSLTSRLYAIPLAEVLTDAKHGAHTHFELVTATLAPGTGVEFDPARLAPHRVA